VHAIWRRSTLVLCALTCASIALAAPARSDAALVPGDLIVADALALGGGALIEVDPSTGAESVLSSNEMAVNSSNPLFNYPFTLAIDAAGNILVANTGNLGGSCSGGCGGVVEVNPTTGAESVLSSNAMPINAASQYFQQPTGITIDAQGDILVSDWGDCDG
jgi:sugar lactone lactonase YvrE